MYGRGMDLSRTNGRSMLEDVLKLQHGYQHYYPWIFLLIVPDSFTKVVSISSWLPWLSLALLLAVMQLFRQHYSQQV
jgi:hypothetical protein